MNWIRFFLQSSTLLIASAACAAPEQWRIFVDYGETSAHGIQQVPAGISGTINDRGPGFGAVVRWASGFGLEAQWQRLDEIEVPVAVPLGPQSTAISFQRDSGQSVGLAATWSRSLSTSLELTGSFGLHWWSYSPTGFKDDGVDPTAGLRLDLNLSPHWQLGVGAQLLRIDGEAVSRLSTRLGFAFD